MSRFDWQTEEDWEELTTPPEEPQSPRPRYVHWLLGLITLLGLTTYFIYHRVEQRVEEATTTVEQDVLSSFDLLQTANNNGDTELVNSVLSGRDPAWTDIQRDLIQHQLLFDRTPFGLTLLGEPTVSETTLAPDLLSAEMHLQTSYAIAIGNGLTETVTLEQIALFRKGSRNWLYAPPDDQFWGKMQSISGSFLTLTYPTRDEEISRRLANDLERKIGELCANIAFEPINCLGGATVDLTLANHSANLVMVNDPALWLQAGRQLTLPAPTLIGLPANEQGYQALFRGYALVVLRAFIGERTGWECCTRAFLVEMLIERQLASLSLQPWPLLADDYAHLLNQGISLENVSDVWNSPYFFTDDEQVAQEAYAFSHFLTTIIPVSAPISLIPQVEGADFIDWLFAYLQTSPFSAEADRLWHSFLYEQSGMAQLAPPIPWPDQAVSMLCGPNFPDAAALQTYYPATDTWTEQLPGHAFFTAQPILDATGLVLVEQPLGAESRPPQTVLWRDGQLTPLLDGAFILHTASHDGNYLAGATLALNPTNPGSSFSSFSTDSNLVLDVSTCGQNGSTCDSYAINLPNLIWSPDNLFTVGRLTRPGSISELRLGDNIGRENDLGAVGVGTSVYWLDNDTLIHLRTMEVVQTNIRTKEAQTLVRASDLLPYLPESSPITRLSINEIALSQGDPNLIFILASGSAEINTAYLFQFNLSDQQITYLTQLDDVPIPAVEIGKNNRLPVQIRANLYQVNVTIVHELSNPVYYFYSYQLAQNKTSLVKMVGGTNLGNFAWSNDGYWLISTDVGILKLIAPGWGYQQWVSHDFANCRAANWLNE